MSSTPGSAFQVAVAARLQFERLSPREKQRLNHLLTDTDGTTVQETRETDTGRFVSRLNAGKRVLWARHDGRATVLSIVDGSYRPEP